MADNAMVADQVVTRTTLMGKAVANTTGIGKSITDKVCLYKMGVAKPVTDAMAEGTSRSMATGWCSSWMRTQVLSSAEPFSTVGTVPACAKPLLR